MDFDGSVRDHLAPSLRACAEAEHHGRRRCSPLTKKERGRGEEGERGRGRARRGRNTKQTKFHQPRKHWVTIPHSVIISLPLVGPSPPGDHQSGLLQTFFVWVLKVLYPGNGRALAHPVYAL